MFSIGTKLNTWLFGQLVGKDEFGNKYYRSKKTWGFSVGRPNTERRWVIYNGRAEPSKVPPQWHGWLHHINDEIIPDEQLDYHYKKNHAPNLSGTKYAYFPPGHKKSGGKRKHATGDYKRWQPK